MSRKKKAILVAAARAREGCQDRRHALGPPISANTPEVIAISSDSDTGSWDGGVNHTPTSDSEFCWTDSSTNIDSAEELTDLDGEELIEKIEEEMRKLNLPAPLAIIMQSAGNTEVWKKAEKNRNHGVTPGSPEPHDTPNLDTITRTSVLGS
ncbi:hypothetical protein PLEOSDRAFT_154753 [Pleurotus ostreatus PC15]|uniref:Uncharacterized protein n=2 Tax=Pleurotus TaxID=5320 RepID=A0A067NQ38_PLEO1|nr:hypothetical protein CCMSSC00406_0009270 [Pleurotus cornucopiae]KDQ30044.1 hypothetical protein PLEOSDRAFT_154753 [Pleurotus ostreatus PC15]